ncbi:CBS domain-containing protein [Leptolyngbya sp. FACHB-1624]|nr:CBS domain-containing protein [Leptolyngbya sp. FACHB-1624]
MPLDHPLTWVPNLEAAIDHHPTIVPPTTLLVDIIPLLSCGDHPVCSVVDEGDDSLSREVRARCVLVMQQQDLLGILTERDIVRLTAAALDFSQLTVAEVMVRPVITLPQSFVQDIFAAVFLFRRYRIRHLPIMNEREQLIGVISHDSIRHILRPVNLLRFHRVSDVMVTQVIQALRETTVMQLVQLMAVHQVSCVVITDQSAEGYAQPIGIVTERDIIQLQSLQVDLFRTQAQTVMSTPLFLLTPNDSLWTALQEMQRRRVGRLVVSWDWGQGLGIITQTDLLRILDPIEMYAILETLQETVHALQMERSGQNAPAIQPLIQEFTQPDALKNPKTLRNPTLLLSLLGQVQHEIQSLMVRNLSVDQQRSQLQSVLENLEKLRREISL